MEQIFKTQGALTKARTVGYLGGNGKMRRHQIALVIASILVLVSLAPAHGKIKTSFNLTYWPSLDIEGEGFWNLRTNVDPSGWRFYDSGKGNSLE